jgi:hypothetical protein
MVLCILHGCGAKTAFTFEKLTSSLMQVEQRLEEDTKTDPSELNSLNTCGQSEKSLLEVYHTDR